MLRKDALRFSGVPIGFKCSNVDHPAIATRLLIEKMIKNLSALRYVAPHSAYLILLYVINQRAHYLSRLSEFEESRLCFLNLFDQPIDEFIALLVHTDLLSPTTNNEHYDPFHYY
jgi:hypothetical protein